MTPGQLRRNKSRQGRLKLKAQESRRLEVQHAKRVARIALASVSPQLLGAIRTGVIDAAMTSRHIPPRSRTSMPCTPS